MTRHDIFRTFSERRYKSWRQSTTQWGCQACRLSSYVKLANLVNLSYPSDHSMRQYHANSSVVLKLVSIYLSVWTIKLWIRFLAFLWSSKGFMPAENTLFDMSIAWAFCTPEKHRRVLWAPLSFLFLPYKFINWFVSSSRGILSWTSEKWWKMNSSWASQLTLKPLELWKNVPRYRWPRCWRAAPLPGGQYIVPPSPNPGVAPAAKKTQNAAEIRRNP